MRLTFPWETYDHLGYPHTKFRPILRGHVQNFGKVIWNSLECSSELHEVNESSWILLLLHVDERKPFNMPSWLYLWARTSVGDMECSLSLAARDKKLSCFLRMDFIQFWVQEHWPHHITHTTCAEQELPHKLDSVGPRSTNHCFRFLWEWCTPGICTAF